MKSIESLHRVVADLFEDQEGIEASLLRQEVVRLYQERRYREAASTARRLLGLQKETVGDRHPGYATSLSQMAVLLKKAGDLAAAEPLLRQALEIRREVLGEFHPDYAASLSSLAHLCQKRGDFAHARLLNREALAIRREVLGDRHPDYATSLSLLAEVFWAQGQMHRAEPLVRQALAIRREVLGDRHPDYATSLNNLALLKLKLGDAEGAEPLLREALAIRREVFGEGHPLSVSVRDSLESLLRMKEPAPSPFLSTSVQGAGDGEGDTNCGAFPHSIMIAGLSAAMEDSPPGRPGDAEWGAAIASSGATDRGSDGLLQGLAALKVAYAELGEKLLDAARLLSSPGALPTDDLLEELAGLRRDFLRFRARAAQMAESLSVRCPPSAELTSLEGVDSLLRAVVVAEARGAKLEAIRSRALAVLDGVLSLVHPGQADFPPLVGCQSGAMELRGAISDCVASELHPDAGRLAEGDHPFASLLRLVRDNRDLDDETWEALHAVVVAQFGGALAAATARARIVLPVDSGTWAADRASSAAAASTTEAGT